MIKKLSGEDPKSSTNSRSSGSGDNALLDSFPQNIQSIIVMLRVVVDQIDSNFKKARELILEIARQLDEGRLCARNEISITIKKILKEKIKEGKVTEKWIEECLAPEYKRQYTKSEPSSLSKQQPKQQRIKVSTEGKQVSPEQQDDDNVIDRPKNSTAETGEASKLSDTIQGEQQDTTTSDDSNYTGAKSECAD